MGRYINDQNKVVLLHESGTYGSTFGTGIWLGEVQELGIDDAENKLPDRFLGNLSRSVGNYVDGPFDVTGTLTTNPSDMRLLAHAIGSVTEISGTTFVHNATEIDTDTIQNPFISGTSDSTTPFSFTMEDSKQTPGTGVDFIRTINGAVINALTLTATQGEKVSMEVDYIGQNLTFSSGATTAVTADTRRPYLWSDCRLTVAGEVIDTAKEVALNINQNIEAPHYVNGSRVIGEPFPQNRDYTLTVTADLTSDTAKTLYEQFWKGGSTLNWEFDLNADTTGSQHATIFVSGATITSMDIPSVNEGVNEQTFEIMAGVMNFVDYVDPATVGSYNPF